jgi:hypothetical protein
MKNEEEPSLLTRRRIEAEILAPVLEELASEFGREAVLSAASRAIGRIAREQGRALAESLGKADLEGFLSVVERWSSGGALRIENRREAPGELSFDVTRCAYADLYREMGCPEVGRILSCGRDAPFARGFGPGIVFSREETILEGAPRCDFRYRCRDRDSDSGQDRGTPDGEAEDSSSSSGSSASTSPLPPRDAPEKP